MREQKIGLALSGGGLFGFAHIGVIEELEANKIKPNLISGSSAGAIIGLLYASGGVLLFDKFISKLKETNLLSGRGLFHARTPDRYFAKIGTLLDTLVRQKDLRSLELPFYPVATDLATGEPHTFEDGDPIDAVLASATYPVAFSSYRIGTHYFLDGGLTKYLPADTLLDHSADVVIGSSIQVVDTLPHTTAKQLGKIGLAIRSVEIMQEQLSEYQLEHCDYAIRPKFNPSDRLRVDLLDHIIEVGRSTAQATISQFKKSGGIFSERL